jgi:hypothetical protein
LRLFDANPATEVALIIGLVVVLVAGTSRFYGDENNGLKDCKLSLGALNMLAPSRRAATGELRRPGSKSALNESRGSICGR